MWEPRWSELVALQVEDVSIMHRRISISRGLVEVAGQFKAGSTKSTTHTDIYSRTWTRPWLTPWT